MCGLLSPRIIVSIVFILVIAACLVLTSVMTLLSVDCHVLLILGVSWLVSWLTCVIAHCCWTLLVMFGCVVCSCMCWLVG